MTRLATGVFPPRIPISFEYGSFMLSFLNCCFTIHFPGRAFLTYPRLNFARPSNMVHKSSNSWRPHLLANFMSSNISASRICNDHSLFRFIQFLLKQELSSAGFSESDILLAKKTAERIISRIMQNDNFKDKGQKPRQR